MDNTITGFESVQTGENDDILTKNDSFEPVQTGITAYLNDLGRLEKATREENAKNIVKYRNGDITAKNRIIEGNVFLVVSVAKKYAQYSKSFTIEDLISVGIEGLYEAIERFDVSKDTSFSTYAYFWIAQKITRELSNKDLLIRLPVQLSDDLRKYLSFVGEYSKLNNGNMPSKEEVMEKLEFSEKKYNSIQQYYLYYEIGSLDYQLSDSHDEDEKTNLYTFISDDSVSLEDYILHQELHDELERIIKTFSNTTHDPARTEDLITSFFGFGDVPKQTLNNLAKKYNCSRQNLDMIIKRFLKWAKNCSCLQIYREDL